MTDWEVIEQHIQNMEEALTQLKKYQDIALEDVKRDLGLSWSIEKGLEVLVQNLLDIGAHILSSEIRNDWDDYGEIIFKLGEHGVIPREFSEEIKGMAGLRNILVHEYMKIDLGRLLEYINNRLGDFSLFMKYIRGYQKSVLQR